PRDRRQVGRAHDGTLCPSTASRSEQNGLDGLLSRVHTERVVAAIRNARESVTGPESPHVIPEYRSALAPASDEAAAVAEQVAPLSVRRAARVELGVIHLIVLTHRVRHVPREELRPDIAVGEPLLVGI